MSAQEQIDYVIDGQPYRTSWGEVFQGGSSLTLHQGFWWYDVGCPIAPEGCEQNLPLIDLVYNNEKKNSFR